VNTIQFTLQVLENLSECEHNSVHSTSFRKSTRKWTRFSSQCRFRKIYQKVNTIQFTVRDSENLSESEHNSVHNAGFGKSIRKWTKFSSQCGIWKIYQKVNTIQFTMQVSENLSESEHNSVHSAGFGIAESGIWLMPNERRRTREGENGKHCQVERVPCHWGSRACHVTEACRVMSCHSGLSCHVTETCHVTEACHAKKRWETRKEKKLKVVKWNGCHVTGTFRHVMSCLFMSCRWGMVCQMIKRRRQ
jgi:hypothetical protein